MSYPATDPRHTAHRRPGARRALDAYIGDGPLDEYAIAARRRALQEEDEEGLAGLVPVDRIIAAVGGLVGGGLVVAAALTVAGIRDALGIRRARASHPDHMTMTGRRP